MKKREVHIHFGIKFSGYTCSKEGKFLEIYLLEMN